jgi:hypothetical protein
MPADLDQFRRKYSHRAVVGGKGLIQLGHMAANARRFVHQIYFKTGSSQIQRGLYAADPAANYHYISKVAPFIDS